MQWYGEKWWHEEQYRRILAPQLTPDRVDRAVACVADVFNTKWSERNEPHPAWMFLLPRGTLPLASLLELGLDLLTMAGSCRLRSVVHDLRQASHYLSTRLELSLAALLKRDGHDVEFRPPLPNGKAADLVADAADQRVFLEVKRLSESEVRISTQRLSFATIAAISDLQRSEPWSKFPQVGYDIELTDQVSGLFGAGTETDQATIGGLVNAIVSEVKTCFARNVPPFDFEVARLARIRIGPEAKCSVGGPTLNPVDDLKRIIMKHLRNAGAQLHPSHPGLLLFQTGSVLDAEMSRRTSEKLLQRQQENTRQVSAAIFLPVYSSFPIRASLFRAFAVFNPSAQVHAQKLTAYRTLSRAFDIAEQDSVRKR